MVTLRHSFDAAKWEGALQLGAYRARDLRPVHEPIGAFLVGVVQRNIDRGGARGDWPDLSEATLLARARGRSGRGQVFKRAQLVEDMKAIEAASDFDSRSQFKRRLGARALTKRAATLIEGAKALIFSGRLLRSITYLAEATYVDVGSNLVYAARQFFGSAPGVKPVTPARNPFELLDEDEAEILRMYLDYFQGAFA